MFDAVYVYSPPFPNFTLAAGHPILCSNAELRCALLYESDWVCKRFRSAAKKWTLCATCCSPLAAAYSSGVHKTLWQCHFDCIWDAEFEHCYPFVFHRTAKERFTVVSYQVRIHARIGPQFVLYLYSVRKCWHYRRLLLTCMMRVLCGKYLLICCHSHQNSETCKSLQRQADREEGMCVLFLNYGCLSFL